MEMKDKNLDIGSVGMAGDIEKDVLEVISDGVRIETDYQLTHKKSGKPFFIRVIVQPITKEEYDSGSEQELDS